MANREGKSASRNSEHPLLPAEQALSDARSIFLETLALNVPELLQELERDVLPLFRAIPQSIKEQKDAGPRFPIYNAEDEITVVKRRNIYLWRNLSNYDDIPEVIATKTATLRWSEPRDLDAPWLLDRTLQTLGFWAAVETGPSTELPEEFIDDRDPVFEARLHFVSLPEVFDVTSHEVEYRHSSWKLLETWHEYEERELRAFRVHLADHRSVQLANGNGFPPDISNYDHFVWMALAYGKRMNFKQIADLPKEARSSQIVGPTSTQDDLGEDTIRKAVHSKAKLIGLPKLRTIRGRPTKHRPKTGIEPDSI